MGPGRGHSMPTTPQETPPAGSRPGATESMPASDRIGKSLTINGRLHGSADLTVDGRVEGEIELPRHELTVGPKGKVEAQLACRSIVVLGAVKGDITATDAVVLRETASVRGAISTPRLTIAEGASFEGRIDMPRTGSPQVEGATSASASRPAGTRETEPDERDDDALLGDDERAVGGPDDGPGDRHLVPAAARMVPPGPDPHRGRGRPRKFNRRAESPRRRLRPARRRDRRPGVLRRARPPGTRPTSRTPAHGPAAGPGEGECNAARLADLAGTPRSSWPRLGKSQKETSGDGWADVWKRHHFAAGGDAPLTAERRLWLPRHLPRHVLRQPAQAPQVASRSCSAEASGCQGDEDRTQKARPGRPAFG